MHLKSLTIGMFFLALVMGFDCVPAKAQQEKGDFEVLALSGGFAFSSGGGETLGPATGLSGDVFTDSSSQTFNISGRVGYFITRKNEVGAGPSLSVFRFRDCFEIVDNGQLSSKQCGSSVTATFGLSGFYRYNFAREGARRFLFVGAEVSVADLVHRDQTGNVQARPFVGYKYFLKKNVALDFSVGYRMDINKFSSDGFSFDRTRSVDGQLGLAFVF